MQAIAISSRAQPQSVLLFGEVLVDRFPERDVLGGAPFNVAYHLLGLGRVLGIRPVLISRVGDDALGRCLLETICTRGLTISGIQHDASHPTGMVLVRERNEAGGHSFEISPDQAWDFIAPDTNIVGMENCPKWIYFGTLAQRAASHSALRSILQAAQLRCFVDINLRDPWVREDVLRWALQQAEIVKVSEEELLRVAKMFGLGGDTPLQMAEQLIHAFDIRQLLVTKGEQGAWALTSSGVWGQASQIEVGDKLTRVVDTVGAGDAFAAVFLLGLILGWSMQLTLDRAHGFAAKICNLRGAIPDSPDFYDPLITAWHLAEGQVV